MLEKEGIRGDYICHKSNSASAYTMQVLRTTHDVCVNIISKRDTTRKYTKNMVLEVFGRGNVLRDKNGNEIVIQRKTIEKILWPS